ncbi:MAG: hypothetical protein ACR2LC_03130 [Pyrinomonadaceae bacterium]
MRTYYLIFILLLLCATPSLAQESQRTLTDSEVTGGIVTLYALDPLAQSFCFRDGKDGSVFYQNEVRNRCSHINFNSYNKGELSVGVQGGELGTIVDLGTADDLKARYGYEEYVGKGQGFASLRMEHDRLVILKERKSQTVQDIAESTQLFAKGMSSAHAPIKLGHIYVMRLTDYHDKSFQLLVKLVVIAYTPGESVTFRWHLL